MERVIIRKAQKDDCKRLMELIHQLAAYENGARRSNGNISAF